MRNSARRRWHGVRTPFIRTPSPISPKIFSLTRCLCLVGSSSKYTLHPLFNFTALGTANLELPIDKSFSEVGHSSILSSTHKLWLWSYKKGPSLVEMLSRPGHCLPWDHIFLWNTAPAARVLNIDWSKQAISICVIINQPPLLLTRSIVTHRTCNSHGFPAGDHNENGGKQRRNERTRGERKRKGKEGPWRESGKNRENRP